MSSSFFFFFLLFSAKVSHFCQDLWKVWDFILLASWQLSRSNFLDAGRKQETAGSETEDVYYRTAGSMSIVFVSSSLSPGSTGAIGSRPSRWCTLGVGWVTLQLRSPELRKPQSFFFFNLFLFIYFIYCWLCWVFVAARGLSLVAVSEGHSSLQCVGFSLWWLFLLQSRGFRRGLQ